MINHLLVPVLITGVIGLVGPALVGRLLERLGVIDVPNSRSSHAVPAIRGAGVAVFCAFAAGLISAIVLANQRSVSGTILLIVLLTSASAALLGWLEDFRGLPVVARATAQLIIGALGAFALAGAHQAAWGWFVLGSIIVAGYINVANFMDGIDGVSGFHGLVVGATFGLLGLYVGLDWLVAAGLIVAVSFAAFLPWNLIRGRMFLGDVGSYLLGASIAAIALAAVLAEVPLLAVVGPMSIYFADTAVTLFRRILNRENWYEAHRSHVYQRLTDSGWSHLRVALVVSLFSCATAVVGLIAIVPSWWSMSVSLVGIGTIAACYLILPSLISMQESNEASAEQHNDEPSNVGTTEPERDTSESSNCGSRGSETWAIVGATGFVGKALSAYLQTRGLSVIELSAPRLTLSPADARGEFSSDSAVAKHLADSLHGVSVVINAAGLATPDATANGALFGANSLLPLVVAHAASIAGVPRYIHLSSAAVQGRRKVLDESSQVEPFSAYSESKALGESALLRFRSRGNELDVVVLRATSVQGAGRRTTSQLQSLARSPLASVARPGNRSTIVSSIDGLVDFIFQLGSHSSELPPIVLQPGEGVTTREVLALAGGKEPIQIPPSICWAVLKLGYASGSLFPSLVGQVRRVEVMWFGQQQRSEWAAKHGVAVKSGLAKAFAGADHSRKQPPSV